VEFEMKTIINALAGNGVLDTTRRIRPLPLVLLGCAVLAGCAGMLRGYEGTAARSDNRLPLAAMSDKAAVWQGKDVAIHYNAAVKADGLHISGSVERLNTIKHYSAVQHFRIYIHFLTADGIILSTKRLWSAGPGIDSTLMRWTFDRHYPLPAGAAAIGFSYRGAFSDGGDDGSPGQTGWEVWERP
jgi:hypothetical protein